MKHVLRLLVVIHLALPLGAQSVDSSLVLRREANSAYVDQDYAKAAARLERLVARSPSDA